MCTPPMNPPGSLTAGAYGLGHNGSRTGPGFRPHGPWSKSHVHSGPPVVCSCQQPANDYTFSGLPWGLPRPGPLAREVRRGIHLGRWSQPRYRTQDCQARAPHPSPRAPGAVSEPYNTSTLTPWGGQHPARPRGQGPKSCHSDLGIIVTPPLAALRLPPAKSPVLALGTPGHPDDSPSQIPTSVPSAKSLLPQG